MPSAAPWNVCVITQQGECSSLSNALLYSDHVEWLNLDVFLEVFEFFADEVRHPGDLTLLVRGRDHEWECKAVDAGGGSQVKSVALSDEYRTFSEYARSTEGQGLLRQYLDSDALTEALEDFSLPPEQPLFPSLLRIAAPALRNSRSIILPAGSKAQINHEWNSYAAAQAIHNAVARLLLPDVASLPIEAILELRERLQDVLDPMRAEVLRLTEDLRKLVLYSVSDDVAMQREAENLVATRVEPLVREASHRTRQLAEQKWRRLFVGAAKAFGFAGASLVDPKLIGKAVQQTLETGALALRDIEDEGPGPRMTAQFVLEARIFVADREE